MKIKISIGLAIFLITLIGNIQAQTDTIPPATPANVNGFSYEEHLMVEWTPNTEYDLVGYKIYLSTGGSFNHFATVSKDKNTYMYFVQSIGVTRYFKIRAYDTAGNESPLTDSVVCTSYDMTDEEFLDMVQRATFRYFYDFGHPVSGLARERNTSGETVTSGGSGFGLMALLVGIQRGYISREEGIERMLKILTFLNYTADRFHGAFSHWLNGTNGNVIPFSDYDNGGDLVETSYLIQGLFTVRQYFNLQVTEEDSIRNLTTQIIDGVEWDWYRRNTNYLYWHWSPNYGWQMNMTVQGPNEAMIVYLLGIASTTHGVPASLFHNGWVSSSYYVNGGTFYGYPIYVGWDYGGPLFFSHYSFLGFDPRNKKDAYCNYFANNRNITLIHKAYCTANPKSYSGYSENCWGLTASDDPTGYRVHEPTYNGDNGTITPSAALSSLPYTPQESIDFLKHIYRTYGNNVWGEYGFKDAFNPTQNWYANSYLAIDQGPIIVMIENYRSGLLWKKFMANPEIQPMLDAIGFVPDSLTSVDEDINTIDDFKLIGNYPNPFNPTTTIVFNLPIKGKVLISIYNHLGEKIRDIVNEEFSSGENKIVWDGLNDNNKTVCSGIYLYKISTTQNTLYGKMILQK